MPAAFDASPRRLQFAHLKEGTPWPRINRAKKPRPKPKPRRKHRARAASAKPMTSVAPAASAKELPDLEVQTTGGGRLRLSSLKGKNVVLYFYPKDDTPGC